eukprot:9094164-Lingulodinium_polyedra.AAC.1
MLPFWGAGAGASTPTRGSSGRSVVSPIAFAPTKQARAGPIFDAVRCGCSSKIGYVLARAK